MYELELSRASTYTRGGITFGIGLLMPRPMINRDSVSKSHFVNKRVILLHSLAL